ncbi:MAG: hypothetical protein KKD74_11495 [Bacteroidetes bacterium]|nr:hypothetical protein [Bacteroidales bacterium]MBU1010751.1 hypothetical protein [Bacteroidota bacterium]
MHSYDDYLYWAQYLNNNFSSLDLVNIDYDLMRNCLSSSEEYTIIGPASDEQLDAMLYAWIQLTAQTKDDDGRFDAWS